MSGETTSEQGRWYEAGEAQQIEGFKEMERMLRYQIERLFDLIENHGCDAEMVRSSASAALDEVQTHVLKYVHLMEANDQQIISRAMLVVSIMVNVMAHNPMYGSHALRLQLRSELDRHLREAGALEFKGDGQG